VQRRAFKPFYFYCWDAKELAEAEANELSAVDHLTNLFGAAAPAFGEAFGGVRLLQGRN